MDALTEAKRNFCALTGYSELNPMQFATWQAVAAIEGAGCGLIVKGPTGSGKTEAVAVPAIATGRRLIMVYPTRSLVDDQVSRFGDMLRRWSESQSHHPVTLTVDTGVQSHRYVYRDGKVEHTLSNANRHLYQGDVIITTLDKFLYRFFGYGEPKKAYIYPLRINYGLKNAIICFDEAHSYEAVAFTNFCKLVRILYERGRDIILMTATMPEVKQKNYLSFLDVIDFVDNETNAEALLAFERKISTQPQHPIRILKLVPILISEDSIEESRNFVSAIIAEATASFAVKRRIIVTVERVEDAVTVWRALKQRFDSETNVLLYHGRLTDNQRQRIYTKLKDIDRAQGGYLLISTSAIEVGCDLDAHVLITQLCDPDRLVQRAGRCNRRKRIADAQVIVIGNVIPSWLTTLDAEDFTLYWDALNSQNGKDILAKPLLACLKSEPKIDYRIEMMFDMLYEYVYEAKLENKSLHDKGFIVTRDWEPSLTLCTGVTEKGMLLDAVSVPMRRCKAKQNELVERDWTIQKRSFSVAEERFTEHQLGHWECAYMIDAVAYPTTTLFDFNPEEGWVQLPKLFTYGYTRGYQKVLVRETEDEGKSQLWYIADLQDQSDGLASTVSFDVEGTQDESLDGEED